jgi:hypothetical protein
MAIKNFWHILSNHKELVGIVPFVVKAGSLMKKIFTGVLILCCVTVLYAEIPHELHELLEANSNKESRAEQQLWLAKYFLAKNEVSVAIECLKQVHEQKKNLMA